MDLLRFRIVFLWNFIGFRVLLGFWVDLQGVSRVFFWTLIGFNEIQ